MINLKDPVKLSCVSLVISFLILTIMLRILKPSCITIDTKKGKTKVSMKILFSFSFTLAIVVAIITFLLFLPKNIGLSSSKFNGDVYKSPYAT